MDDYELEHAEPASTAIEQMVIEPAEPTSNNAIEQMDEESRTQDTLLDISGAGVPVVLAAYEERFRIPAEEQSAGCRLFLQGGVPGAWVTPRFVFR